VIQIVRLEEKGIKGGKKDEIILKVGCRFNVRKGQEGEPIKEREIYESRH
jgi:hypothetical protein